jgi:1,4-dihydroxy-2-naphthoate octaprenyltransferase
MPWIRGARPRTLPAALVPVAVGTAMATTSAGGDDRYWAGAVALLVSLALQVGVNYANDYSDGVRGVDADRVGPTRLVGSGAARPSAVRAAAFVSFGVAAASGLVLAALVSWWLLPVGAVSIAAGWLYTGGPRPYGYMGLGEVFVFVFFGLVATMGTEFVVSGALSRDGLLAAIVVGLLAVALLVINNLRDIPGDRESGKRTLAVRLGDGATRRLFVAVVAVTFVTIAVLGLRVPGAMLGLVGAPFAVAPVTRVMRGDAGRDLVAVLGATARLQMVAGLMLAAGVASLAV